MNRSRQKEMFEDMKRINQKALSLRAEREEQTESSMELFDKWLLTEDKEEFLKLTPQVHPNMSKEEIEELASKMKW